MQRNSRITRFACAVFAAIAVALTGSALASEEVAAAEKLDCTACHEEDDGRALTDHGKYYEALRTMEGFDELRATFGKCTTCHEAEPGSKKLTERGEQFRFMVIDMEGLAAWMRKHHPTPPPPEGDPEPEASKE